MVEPSMDEQDRADMARLSGGHEAALNSLMGRHGARLVQYLLRQTNNETDAAELAQESFVRVYQHRARFDASQRFSTWLYTIATNLLRDRFRWHKRHPQVSLDSEPADGRPLRDSLVESAAGPDQRLDSSERAEQVRQAIACLPEELRMPLILSEYEQRSHAEIGTILGCTPKAVETRLYRARGFLRKQLAKLL
jgi:RNA polymerase sigma factor (sigma-70 family)